jgi:hypothetical protein
MRRAFLFAVVAATAGCPASINGKIDGQGVDTLYSAFMINRDNDVLTLVNASAVSLLDGCNGAARQKKAANDELETYYGRIKGEADPERRKRATEDYLSALVDYDVKNLPTDYWTVSISAAAADPRDIDGTVEINLKNPDPEAEVAASVQLCRVNDHPELKETESGDFRIKRNEDCFIAKRGDVDIKKFDEDKSFQAVADVEVIQIFDGRGFDLDDDGDDVVINFSGGFCKPLLDEIQRELDIEEDFRS